MTTNLRIPIAARIERLPESNYLRLSILLISLGTFWDSYMLFSVGPISAHFFAYLGQPHFATELPLALFFGTFVGAVGLSTVADKIGRRGAFTLDLCILATGALLAAFSPNATVLLIALFIAGIGTGAELPLSTTYVQELSPARARGKMSSFALTIGFLGGTVGGFASMLLVPLNDLPLPGFRIALLLAALGGFSSLLLRMGLPESPRWLERMGRRNEADDVMDKIERRVMTRKEARHAAAPAENGIRNRERRIADQPATLARLSPQNHERVGDRTAAGIRCVRLCDVRAVLPLLARLFDRARADLHRRHPDRVSGRLSGLRLHYGQDSAQMGHGVRVYAEYDLRPVFSAGATRPT